MQIGVVKEIKNFEGRVAMTPEGIKDVLESNPEHHVVFVQTGAGIKSGYSDQEYIDAGATICSSAEEVYEKATLMVHVKEPLPEEFQYLRPDHILFTYLHLAADTELTKELMQIGLTGIAYETLEVDHHLPLLAPMSKVAGKMAFVYGTYCQQKKAGGIGIYVGEIDGRPGATVMIIGGGVVGTNAADSFNGIGTNLLIVEKSEIRQKELKGMYPKAQIVSPEEIDHYLPEVDIVIGAVLIAGAKAPHLISLEQIRKMKPGAVIVDISIDQGGITEVSRATSIENPTFMEGEVVICCIPNIPGTVPRTSTQLLTKETIPYVKLLANHGLTVLKEDPRFQTAANIVHGKLTNHPVAEATGLAYTPLKDCL